MCTGNTSKEKKRSKKSVLEKCVNIIKMVSVSGRYTRLGEGSSIKREKEPREK